MEKKNKQRGLGRGLSALMADIEETPNTENTTPKGEEKRIPIEQIIPNPDQPRRIFNQSDLDELAASIRGHGIIQPLIVREKGASYEIVAGERRWRAAQMAQLHDVPVVIREFNDQEVLEIAIIENIQRADLNPIEEALGFKQLMDKFGHTQEKLAEALGKSRSHIANLLRLLTLPDDIQNMVKNNKLSAGHARALITATDPISLAQKVVGGGLSVRDTEKLVKAQSIPKQPFPKNKPSKDADTKALEGDLSATLKMPVTIEHAPGADGGTIKIRYKTLEQLDDICRALGGG